MKKFFLCGQSIIPNVYQDKLYLYDNIFKDNFDKDHAIGLERSRVEKLMMIVIDISILFRYSIMN